MLIYKISIHISIDGSDLCHFEILMTQQKTLAVTVECV